MSVSLSNPSCWMLQACQHMWKITFTCSTIASCSPLTQLHADTQGQQSCAVPRGFGVWNGQSRFLCYFPDVFLHLPLHCLQTFLNSREQAGPAQAYCKNYLPQAWMLYISALCSSSQVYMSVVPKKLQLVPWETKKIFFGLRVALFFLNPPLTLCSILFCIFLFFLSSLCSPFYSLPSLGFSCHPTTDTIKLYNKSYTPLHDLISHLYCIEDIKSCKAINKVKIHGISIYKL